MEYYFERLSDENLHLLIPLYKKVFDKRVNEEYVISKYNTSYLGKKYLGYIAINENNEAIAYNGGIPFNISYKGKPYIGVQFGDAMTLPDYAGKGLFTKCGSLSNELIKQENIPLIYGFPNQNSSYGYFHNLKWTKLHHINRYNIKCRTISFSKFFNKIGLKPYQNIRKEILNKYATEEILENSSLIDDHAGSLRNYDFYNYKSFLGNKVIKINGIKVWLKLDNDMLIGDIEKTDPLQFWKIIETLKEINLTCGCNNIVFQVSPNSYLDTQLSKKLSPRSSWTAGFLDLGVDFDPFKLKFNYGDLDTF